MCRSVRAVVTLATALNILLPAVGHTEPIWVFGVGTKSCGAFLVAKAGPPSAEYVAFQAWLGGFMTGINRVLAAEEHAMIRDTALEAIEALVEQRCRVRPEITLFTAAEAVAASLLESRTPLRP